MSAMNPEIQDKNEENNEQTREQTAVDPALFRKIKKEADAARKELESLRASQLENERAKMTESERLRQELETYKNRSSELDIYKSHAEQQRDELMAQLPENVRQDVSESIDGLAPLAQIKQIRSILKIAGMNIPKQEPKKNVNVDRSSVAQSNEHGAPRSYSEWKNMPDGPVKNKYRTLAMTLPE